MYDVLIVEDDAALLRGLTDNFVAKGYRVHTASDGQVALDTALTNPPDLIVLDIMIPLVNGYDVCRRLRLSGLEVPVLMLTAKGEESDIVRGLELGADDYVTKPFSIRQLLARCASLLRRLCKPNGDGYQFGHCLLDVASHRLLRDGQEIPLTTKEFRMLEVFVKRPSRAITRNELINKVWGQLVIVSSRSVDRCITTLRGKIEPDPKHPTHIHTIRDIGYRFETGDEH